MPWLTSLFSMTLPRMTTFWDPGSDELVMNWMLSLCFWFGGDFMLRKSLPWISTSFIPASSMPSLDMAWKSLSMTSRFLLLDAYIPLRNPVMSESRTTTSSEFLMRRPMPSP